MILGESFLVPVGLGLMAIIAAVSVAWVLALAWNIISAFTKDRRS